MSNDERPRILFQLTGSIACFKACELVSRLAKRGVAVQTVASAGALRFVGAATLEGLTGRVPFTDLYEPGRTMDHIRLARWADPRDREHAQPPRRRAGGRCDRRAVPRLGDRQQALTSRARDERDDVGTSGDARRAREARALRRPAASRG
jgi:hypothetical protein